MINFFPESTNKEAQEFLVSRPRAFRDFEWTARQCKPTTELRLGCFPVPLGQGRCKLLLFFERKTQTMNTTEYSISNAHTVETQDQQQPIDSSRKGYQTLVLWFRNWYFWRSVMAKWNELIKGRQNITGTTECIISNTSKTQDEIQNQQQPMAEWDLVISGISIMGDVEREIFR